MREVGTCKVKLGCPGVEVDVDVSININVNCGTVNINSLVLHVGGNTVLLPNSVEREGKW